MARPPQIRITKNDRAEYARLARNTKAKIRRTEKNYGIDLSGEIEIPNIESFQTREQFNEWKQKQASFTNRHNLHYQFRKNEYGVVASKKRISDIERNTKRAQRIAEEFNEKLKDKPFFVAGKQHGTVEQRMLMMGKPNQIGLSRPPDFDFSKIKTERQLRMKEESMQEKNDLRFVSERLQRMKTNFIKKVEESFNSDADELVELLKGIPADDFYELYLMSDSFEFDLFYTNELEGHSHNHQIMEMMEVVNQYYSSEINMDLKGFK